MLAVASPFRGRGIATALVKKAIDAMDMMVHDEPVMTAKNSMRQILKIVEQVIAKQPPGTNNNFSPPDESRGTASVRASEQMFGVSPAGYLSMPSMTTGTGTMMNAAEDSLYLSNPQEQQAQQLGQLDPMAGTDSTPHTTFMSGTADKGASIDFLNNFNYDVLTTDLFNLFPIQITTPEDGVHQGGANGTGGS